MWGDDMKGREKILRLLLRFLEKMGVFSFAFHVKRVESKRDRSVFERLWTATWLQEGYATRVTLPTIREHYAPYNGVSIDLLCTFLWVFPVGTMRIIMNVPRLPVLTDFQISAVLKGSVAEITLLTIRSAFQGFGHHVALLLFREMYRHTREQGMDGIVVAADRRLWILLRRFLHLPFSQIGKEQTYEGSITFPGHLDFTAQERLILGLPRPRNLLEKYVWKRFGKRTSKE